MKNEKKCKVLLLPTNEKAVNTKEYQLLLSNSLFWTSKIDIKRYTGGWFFLNNSSNPNSYAITVPNVENFKHQHLYIISDDEIKGGDWFYNIHSKIVGRAAFDFGKDDLAKKIIATTDTSLNETDRFNGKLWENLLPIPSQQFIEKYIEEYNKGQQITECLVEYEEIYPEHFTYNPNENVINRLKVDKNNTITIKKVKNSYTQEEVDRMLDEQASKTTAEMLEKFKGYKSRDEVIENLKTMHINLYGAGIYELEQVDNWIKENL